MPESLQQLLENRQALEIIPGVLYFASLWERLEPIGELRSITTSRPVSASSFLSQQRRKEENDVEVVAAAAALDFSLGTVSETLRTSIPLRNRQQQFGFFSPQLNVRLARSTVARGMLLRRILLLSNDSGSDCGGTLENGVFYFSVGESTEFQYRPLNADFGPLGLDCVTRFSRILVGLLEHCSAYVWGTDSNGAAIFGPQLGADNGNCESITPVVFCSGTCNYERANAACLLACFCVTTLRWSALETINVFKNAYPPIVSFRDAGPGISAFPLTLLDIVSGLEKAVFLGWYDVRTFDIAEYYRLRSYDCSWVIPQTILALSSPTNKISGNCLEMYAKLFQKLKVTHLVRLNEFFYRKATFLANGIQIIDLKIPDGGITNDNVINCFMRAVEPILFLPQRSLEKQKKTRWMTEEKFERTMEKQSLRQQSFIKKSKNLSSSGKNHGAIAVHCNTGLGKTGTLICVYMMFYFGFTARESIGWIRLCRPGSVIGSQQMFLEKLEQRILRQGDTSEGFSAECAASVIRSGIVDKIRGYRYQTHGFWRLSATKSSVLCLPKTDAVLELAATHELPEASVQQKETVCNVPHTKRYPKSSLHNLSSFCFESLNVKPQFNSAELMDSFVTRRPFSSSCNGNCDVSAAVVPTENALQQREKMLPSSHAAAEVMSLTPQQTTYVTKQLQCHKINKNNHPSVNRAKSVIASPFLSSEHTAMSLAPRRAPNTIWDVVSPRVRALVYRLRSNKASHGSSSSCPVATVPKGTHDGGFTSRHCECLNTSTVGSNGEDLVAANTAAGQLGAVPLLSCSVANVLSPARCEQIKAIPAWGVGAVRLGM